jgi:hypothetical protein
MNRTRTNGHLIHGEPEHLAYGRIQLVDGPPRKLLNHEVEPPAPAGYPCDEIGQLAFITRIQLIGQTEQTRERTT